MSRELTFNFSAGPCTLPDEILQIAQRDLLNYNNSGMSVMEMSHRSKAFLGIYEKTVKDLKTLMNVPENYDLIFVQGGATLVFTMLAMNLVPADKKVGFVVTGTWSKKAYDEAKIVIGDRAVILANTKDNNHTSLPLTLKDKLATLDASDFAYTYICENETIHGVELPTSAAKGVNPNSPIDLLEAFGAPIVNDVSSNFCSRPYDVSRFGVIFGGVQKNLGPAGAAVVVIRKDMTERTPAFPVPTYLSFKTHVDNESMYNTPPCWTIYMVGLMAQWMLDQGGLAAIDKIAQEKSQVLYDAIERSNGFFVCPVQKDCRSRMNIPFRVRPDDAELSAALEKEFLDICSKARLLTLAGHRSVGGLRASLYNGMPMAGVEALVALMDKFRAEKTAAQ